MLLGGFIIFILLIMISLYLVSKRIVKQVEEQYPPKGKFVEVEGIKLHYIEQGSGQPVVFLHGGILSSYDFEQVLEKATEQGYRAIAFDRPGYGFSQRPQEEMVTPRVQARLIHGALRQLGVEKPILVAHSWSGLLVLTYALDYPEDVSGIVTLGGGMYKKEYPVIQGDPLSKLVTSSRLGQVLLHTILIPVGYVLAGSMIKATFAPEQPPSSYVRTARALWFRPAQFKANREDVLAFAPACDEISGQYKAIKTPAVIIIGEQDPFSTKIHSEWLHKDLPYAKLFNVPDAAHMLPQKHPDVVWRGIKELSLGHFY